MGRMVMKMTTLLLLLPLVFSLFFGYGQAISLRLPETGVKCLSVEIQTNVVVVADYAILGKGPNYEKPIIGAKVTSPNGNTLHSNKNVEKTGQFAFTTNEAGYYLACFWVTNKISGGSVSINWKIGIAAKDWDSVAKIEKIEGVELELKKLEGAVEAIHQNLIRLKSRETDMRTVSEITNSRVAWLSIMSIGVCLGVSTLQLWHLKSFFRKKKLI